MSRSRQRALSIDAALFAFASLALVLFGLVMVYSASSVSLLTEGKSPSLLAKKQFAFAISGLATCIVLWLAVPSKVWRGRSSFVFWTAAMLSILSVALVGVEALGAKRWLSFGPIGLQPSEFSKITVVVLASVLMGRWQEGRIDGKTSAVLLALTSGIPMACILVLQSDLGTAMVCAVGVIAVLWVGRAPMPIILAIVFACLLAAFASVTLVDYRADRMAVLLNPWNDGAGGTGAGWQLIQSRLALASGGLFGRGIGMSRAKYGYLPEAETDFIFAIIGEECGLAGCIAVLALFSVLLWTGIRISTKADNRISGNIAVGLTTMLVFQAILNISCVMGLLPTTGKPLPFISAGGSSLLSTLCAVGLVLSVDKEKFEVEMVHARRRSQLRVLDNGVNEMQRETKRTKSKSLAPRKTGQLSYRDSMRRSSWKPTRWK